MKDFFLQGKNIVITGASSGIGKACAQVAAMMGAKLLLLGRDQTRLNETLVTLEGNHTVVAIDITEDDRLKKAISDFAASNGYISGFIHAAGIEKTMPLSMSSDKDFLEIFGVNFQAGIKLAKHCSHKKIIDPAGASFVYISSILSINGKAGTTYYSASKGAINAAVKSLAVELCKKQVRVNCVLPSVVTTDMIEKFFETLLPEAVQKRKDEHLLGFGEPTDVANACCFLLSTASKWITGTELVIDGGYSCL